MNAFSKRVQAGLADNSSEVSGGGGTGRRRGRARLLPLLTLVTLVAGVLPFAPAGAASVTSASFMGGGVLVDGTRYAKQGHILTLTVNTSDNTKCVEVTGLPRQTSNSGQSSWTFSVTAPAGNGVQNFTVTAGEGSNNNGCHTRTATVTNAASYVLDNTGPALLPSNTNKTGVSPAPNAAGWNNSNVTIGWSATDASSGVGSGPTPSSDSVTANTSGVVKTATAADRLGNPGSGSVTIKLDKTEPTINGSRTPLGNEHGWNNTDVTASFTCSDALSGMKTCPGSTTFVNSGAGQSVSGSAQDNADNSASATVGPINIDKTAPTLTGTPAGTGNALGWRKTDVTVNWACSDQANLSGINGSCPAASTISSEGENLTDTTSVSDKAGNTTVATSSPAVKLDKTRPTTSASAPATWNNVDVTVQLTAGDNLSGVKSTHYSLNGGSQQTGTSIPISADGEHTLEYWSVDNADNEELHRTITVKIDKTPPTISADQSPAANEHRWNNSAVTVTFTCADGASGVATCTADGGTGASRTVSADGSHEVTGTAVDNAGNRVTGRANVNIDTIAPTISAARDGVATNGWYKQDVVVTFTCNDERSGIVAGAAGCTERRTLGEGGDQSVTGTARDAAGNSWSVTESGINVDKTPPLLSGAPTTSPTNGWYRGDVTIRWSASDPLSGLWAIPSDDVLTGEGSNVCASKTVTDLAGNPTTRTVCVAIDRQPPTTSASVPDPLDSGWYAGAVRVSLNALDSLSQVASTYYSVNSEAAQLYSVPFDFDRRGVHTIRFWSVDNAGNVEDRAASNQAITLRIDGIAPTIDGSRSPAANTHGWNNSPVTVSFDCSDAESGIASCTDPVTLSNQGAGQSVTGRAVDQAGNSASATVGDINIDTTLPSLSGAPTTPATAGWYRGDVAIAWTGSDGLSGIDPATQPANSVITGEGSNLGAGPVSISDKAGNPTTAPVSGIKIDRRGPSITAVRPAATNGWYNAGVTIGFNCADPALADGTAGSGVAACPSDRQVTTNGANQSVTSDLAADIAGNTTPGITVGGINVDALAPQSSANNVCTGKNGWCRGATATVRITAADQDGLSGVKEIRYSVNGGNERFTAGSSASVEVPLNGTGEANVVYYAVDNAGNAERANGIALKYDNIAPTVTNSITPAANGAGWHKADATVAFSAKDDDGGSGVDTTTVPGPQTLTEETTGTVVSAIIEDLAGNETTDSVTVKIDKTAPTVSGSIVSGTQGSNGWYTGPVTVRFACADPNAANGATGSGVPSTACPGAVDLADGANQSVTRSVSDRAGNTASATVSGINVDSGLPTVSVGGVAHGGVYTLGAVPQATCIGSDAVSGPGSCTVGAPSGGQANGVGTWSVTAMATDNAGNVNTASVTYRVIYKWSGVSQPVNDPTADANLKPSVFKAGSTVPVKLRLRNAGDTVVQANTLPAWTTPQKGGALTAPVDEALVTEPPTSGSTYRWDGADQQYIYNYGTSKTQGGNQWRIGVKLDDGNTYVVDIGLRS